MAAHRTPVRERFNIWLAHRLVNPLHGVLFRDWRRLLREPGIEFDRGYRARRLTTTLSSLANTIQARREHRCFHAAIASAVPLPPIFILGHYRSGTTLLHNLLDRDPRLASPSYYQVTFPHTFLATERSGVRWGSRFSMSKRPFDDVDLGLEVPAEDELALCASTFASPHMGWHFPRLESRYRRYLTFREAEPAERAAWSDAFRRFARKLTVRYDRPIVYKSPCHTARIPLILETFPDAKFVHIHRNPVDVFRSTRHMERKAAPLFQFQTSDEGALDERIFRRYSTMYDAFLDDRTTLREGRLVEVSYDELTAKPLDTLRKIYTGLALPEFETLRPEAERYVAGLDGYRRNRHAQLPEETERRIVREWGRFFDAWRYPRPAGRSRC